MNAVPATFIEDPSVALATDEALEALCASIKAEIKGFTFDVSTAASRARIASLAHRITKTKTAIDAAGKAQNEEARSKINAVDARRRKVRETMEALAEEARKPLADWEEAEAERDRIANAILDRIVNLPLVTVEDGSNFIGDRLASLEGIEISEAVFGKQVEDVEKTRARAVESLKLALGRAVTHEADRAELAQLRAQNEARAAADEAKAKTEREATETRRRLAEAAAREAEAAAAAERAAALAVEQAREEERQRANRAIAAAQAEAAAAVAASARAEEVRLSAIAAAEAEERARTQDREHRDAVIAAAFDAIVAQGTSGNTGKKIVLAIMAGEIPNVTLRF